MIAFYFLLAVLATWRLTYDVVSLDGPFGLYNYLRTRITSSNAPIWLKDGITCGYCISFWVGIMIALFLPWRSWQEYALYALSCSGAVTLIARYCKAMYGADLFD